MAKSKTPKPNENKASLTVFKQANVCRMEHCSLIKIPYEGMSGAWLILSFQKRKSTVDEYEVQLKPFMTFFFDSGKGAGAEWEPEFGPIQKWVKTGEHDKTKSYGGRDVDSRKHWFYGWVQDNCFAWSQTAVDREGLKPALLAGDFGAVFEVLKRWSQPENVSADSIQGMLGGAVE